MTTSVNNATEQDNAVKQVITISYEDMLAQCPARIVDLSPVGYFKAVFDHDSALGLKRTLWNIIKSSIGNELSGHSAQEQQEMLDMYSLFSGAIDKMKLLTLSSEDNYRNIQPIGNIPAGSLWSFADDSFVLADADQHRTLPANEWAESFYHDPEASN